MSGPAASSLAGVVPITDEKEIRCSRLLALAPVLFLWTPAHAQSLPPADGLPLSQVIATVEKAEPVRVFTEVEWDDDGYWDVEFINQSNRRTSIRIDPFTAEPWSRRNRR